MKWFEKKKSREMVVNQESSGLWIKMEKSMEAEEYANVLLHRIYPGRKEKDRIIEKDENLWQCVWLEREKLGVLACGEGATWEYKEIVIFASQG